MSELLKHYRTDPWMAMRAYEQLRVKRANKIVADARWMGKMNGLKNPVVCYLRDKALALAISASGMPPVDAMYGYDYAEQVATFIKNQK